MRPDPSGQLSVPPDARTPLIVWSPRGRTKVRDLSEYLFSCVEVRIRPETTQQRKSATARPIMMSHWSPTRKWAWTPWNHDLAIDSKHCGPDGDSRNLPLRATQDAHWGSWYETSRSVRPLCQGR
jgi:hypothetical protein